MYVSDYLPCSALADHTLQYVLIRPAPSLRVLFASPSLRTPGVLQSHFLHRIGGARMRQDLDNAFQEAKVVTARVRWLKSLSEDGEGESSTRWLHCTPLMHHTVRLTLSALCWSGRLLSQGNVGLWMIVVVMPSKEDKTAGSSKSSRSGGSRLADRPSDANVGRQDRTKTRYGQR